MFRQRTIICIPGVHLPFELRMLVRDRIEFFIGDIWVDRGGLDDIFHKLIGIVIATLLNKRLRVSEMR